MDQISTYIHILKDPLVDETSYVAAVKELSKLLVDDTTKYEATKALGEATIKVLKTETSEPRLSHACHLIWAFCYKCERAKVLLGKDYGAIPPLLRALTIPSFDVRHQASQALISILAGGQKLKLLFQNADGVAITTTCMSQVPSSISAKSQLLLILNTVSGIGAMAKQIIDCGSVPLLIELAKGADQPLDIRSTSSEILANIASHSDLLPILIDKKILEACQEILKLSPIGDADFVNPLADHALAILCHVCQDDNYSSKIDIDTAIIIARRCRQINSRDHTQMSKPVQTYLQLLVGASYNLRQNPLYRLKMETADPDAVLGPKPAAPNKQAATIGKLVIGLYDTDEPKSLEAAKQLLDLMQKDISLKKDILEHEGVFAKLWKLARQGRLGWEDKWYVTIDSSKLKFKEELGSGAFSTVYRGTLKTKGKKEQVAIKALDESVVDLPDLRTELATLSLLNGVVENMVGFNGYMYLSQKNTGVMKVTKKYHCLVMELMETNLEEVLHDPKKRVALSEMEVLRIAYDMCLGMAKLHSFTVLHRDLKPANILLSRRKEPTPWLVKIADFGYARRDSTDSLRKSVVGTPAYLAPELVGHTKSEEVGKPADVYSFGVILWEMLSRKKPHDGMESASLFHHVITAVDKHLPIFTAAPEWDRALGELMSFCTHAIPSKRPTFSQLVVALAELIKQKEASQSSGK